jgi:Met-10+ like-protein
LVQRLLYTLAQHMPERVRSAVLRSSNRPTRLTNAIHSFLNRLPGERFPVVACHGPLEGHWMRFDWHLLRSFMNSTWEPEVVKTISTGVQRGSVVADIGAHTGYYTLLRAKLVGPQRFVYSSEPVPENFEELSENIRLNHCEWVKALKKAAVERAGRVEAFVPAGEPFPETACITGHREAGIEVLKRFQ